MSKKLIIGGLSGFIAVAVSVLLVVAIHFKLSETKQGLETRPEAQNTAADRLEGQQDDLFAQKNGSANGSAIGSLEVEGPSGYEISASDQTRVSENKKSKPTQMSQSKAGSMPAISAQQKSISVSDATQMAQDSDQSQSQSQAQAEKNTPVPDDDLSGLLQLLHRSVDLVSPTHGDRSISADHLSGDAQSDFFSVYRHNKGFGASAAAHVFAGKLFYIVNDQPESGGCHYFYAGNGKFLTSICGSEESEWHWRKGRPRHEDSMQANGDSSRDDESHS